MDEVGSDTGRAGERPLLDVLHGRRGSRLRSDGDRILVRPPPLDGSPRRARPRPPAGASDGILLVYNGADDRLVYRTGWALFDGNDPTRVRARSDDPLFEPQRPWETAGRVPNVVFVEGLVREGPRWLFYYGGADQHVGVAEALGTGREGYR